MQIEEFIALLTSCSEELQAEHARVQSEWHPERPPITTLFAALGERIADGLESADHAVNGEVLGLIEQAMQSGDSNLVTAVATGLVESLVARVSRKKGNWELVAGNLGPLSLRHARAWLNA